MPGSEHFEEPSSPEARETSAEVRGEDLSEAGATVSTSAAGPTIKEILKSLVAAVEELNPKPQAPKRFQKTSEQISALWTIAIKVAGFSILALVTLLITWTILSVAWSRNNNIEISGFEVAPELAKNGLSSQVIAGKLADRISLITSFAQSNLAGPVFKLPSSEAVPDIEIPETGTSLRTVTRYLSEVVGRPQKISGELTRQGEDLQLVVRITNRRRSPDVSHSFQGKDLNQILNQAAQYVMKQTGTLILAWYKYKNDEKEEALNLVNYYLYNQRNESDCYAHTLMGVLLTDAATDYNRPEKYEEAAKEYMTSVGQCPHYAPAYIDWGYTLEAQGGYKAARAKEAPSVEEADALKAEAKEKFIEAAKKYEHAQILDPKSGLAYVSLGGLLLSHGDEKDRKKALELFRKATVEAPSYPWGYAQLGYYFYQKRGQYDEAIKMYRIAQAVDPEFSVSYYYWGELIETADAKTWDPAIEKFRMATELDPKFADAYFKWANLLIYKASRGCQECDAEAEKVLAKISEVAPEKLDIRFDIGNSFAENDRFKEASRYYDMEALLDEKHNYPIKASRAYGESGNALLKMQLYCEAAERYEKAIKLNARMKNNNPEAARAFATCGAELIRQQRFCEALEKYTLLLEVHKSL